MSMAPSSILGGSLPVAVVVLIAVVRANGEDSAGFEAGIRVYQDVDVVVTQKNGQLLLNCSVKATSDFGPFQYEWLKDDKLIEFEEVNPKIKLLSNGSLYFKKFRKRKRRTDEGDYTCIVKNSIGSVIANHVHVQVANVAKNFTREPLSQEAFVGGSARFECRIDAFPAPIFKWEKARTDLPQDSEKYILFRSGVLHINNLTLEDTGLYRCITSHGELHTLPDVIDTIRWRHSREAALTVKTGEARRKPRIIDGNLNVTTKTGETAILECLVDGSPLPNVTWHRQDRKSLSQYVSYVGHKNLKIRSVQKEDAGTYVCTASSRGFKDVSVYVTLTVNMSPIITTPPQTQRWPRARTVILKCEVDAVPEAMVRWYRDGELIKPGQPFEFRSSSLVIYNVELKHDGYYQCIAENSVGRDTAFARLEIFENNGSPKPPQGLKAHALTSKKIFVQWNKSESPPELPILTYVVSVVAFNGAEALDTDFVIGEEAILNTTMDQLKPFTNYSVYVKAFNKKGASPRSVNVRVQTLEDIPVACPEIILSTNTPNTIQVEWKEMLPSLRNGIITEYEVHYKTKDAVEMVDAVDGSKSFYTIRDVQPDEEYNVRVLARTKKGYPVLSDAQWPWVPIRTSRLISSFPMPHLHIVRKNASVVVVKWAIDDQQGKVETYQIQLKNLQDKGTVLHTDTITGPAEQYVLTDLDNSTEYEVTITARGNGESSGPVAMEFRTTEDGPVFAAKVLNARTLNAATILLTWMQPGSPHRIKQFDVCYQIEMGKTQTCKKSLSPSVSIAGLKPFTKYKFTVRTHFQNNDVKVSSPLIAQTQEDIPSAPTNITWIVVSPGTVELHWKPPASPNGVITSYIIFYNNNNKVPDTMWRNLTQTGGLTQATVDELTAASYFFKLRACTRAGQGRPSQIVVVYPNIKCTSQTQQQERCRPDTIVGPGANTGRRDKQLGIIVGVTIGIVCIVICIVVIVFRNRCFRSREPPPIYHGNGHLPGHGNGHAVHVTTNRLSVPSSDIEALTPMLNSLQENTESDSKGGGTLIVTPNGVRMNGISQSLQNGHVPNGHVTRREGNVHLGNRGSSEEHHGLIAAIQASSESSPGSTGREMSTYAGESLEEIDGSLEDESQLTSVVTAPNGEAAMLKVTASEGGDRPRISPSRRGNGGTGAAQAASSSPTLRNNGSGGGGSSNAADSTTSSHLPSSNTTLSRDQGQGHEDLPPTPPPPLASSTQSSTSTQECPEAPGTHVDSLPPRVGAGILPHMFVRDGTWAGLEQSDSVV
ncbi:protogenin-like [Haliotis cracherodii]|uniref:protogenin-like n=1 Tax=Haliotis cracherodii TaxID=6455 RepID=UPI0039E904B6